MISLFPALAFALTVPAPANPAPPPGLPPTLTFVRARNNGDIEYQLTETKYVPVEKQFTVNVNGRVEIRKTIENQPVTVIQMKLLDKSTFEVHNLEGKKVDEADWTKSLKDGAIVLLASGQLPDAAYIKAMKAGTLVVVSKSGAPMVNRALPTPIKPLPPN